jgi:PAS domain S-box-containing protein
MSDSITVLVAEDEEPLRLALVDLIRSEPGFEVVAVAADADEAIARAVEHSPDVALLGVKMPGGGGRRVAAEMRLGSPDTAIVILSAYDDRATVIDMLRAGAIAYLLKGTPPEEMLEALRRAVRGQASLDGVVAADLARELTARSGIAEHEQHFAALLESAPDAVVIIDAGGAIVLVNAQTESLFAYKRTELLGRPIETLLPDRFHDRHLGHREQYAADPRTRPWGAGLELAGRRKDGSEFPVDISLSSIATDSGLLMTAFVRDITERKAADELRRNLHERRVLLEHLVSAEEEERRRIAGDIHDDSIQAMTAAGMRLQILRRALVDPAHAQLLDDLQQTIRLAISRLRHLLFELRPPALDREGLVPALRAYLDEVGANSRASFRLEDATWTQPPERLHTLVYRIVQEAITNARKHSEATEIVVAVDEQHDGFVLRVTDNGVGFHVTTKTPRAGHLGLVAMRERAELAGGTLRTESEPGRGTTVELWIPREDQRAATALA